MRVLNNAGITECYDVTLRSFRYVDTGIASATVECFTNDAVLDRYGDVTVGGDELLQLFTERENDVSRTTCHAVVNFSPVEVARDQCIEAHYALLVFEARPGEHSSQLAGVRLCFDRYARREGRWLIEHRRQEHLGLAASIAAAKEAK
ncbi:hypothetical protein GCM10010915_09850 [Microbacterium faecale]|uniref:SnoaL-like domain-containing protein n=1 Tax=Microbacterium faecale TaxID=1804630 RepID=A0A917DF25_9MICO|nr:nuclear transport factor 2 family protein [Microbacterium faecale]GGD31565.1 hypothetical protein GCM10010915_09850 [Microbacterium faecale]